MKHTLLYLACVLATGVAAATDAPAAAPAPRAAAKATARADADADAAADAKAAAARRELGELRAQMRDLSRRMADLSTQLGDVGPRAYAFRYIGDPDRAMVGIVLGVEDGQVVLGGLTPDGPAARAGLRSGDVITAIDGQAVAGKTPREAVDRARGLLADLKEGQAVSIEYRRGTQKGVVVVNAERREALNWPALMNEDPEHPFLPKDFDERIRADVERASHVAGREAQREAARSAAREAMAQARGHMDSEQVREAFARARESMRHSMPWWGLNLAPMNGELGRYFGTDRGALVIASDEASLPGLRGGDVITAVGKDAIARPEDVMRALRDQPEGKDVAIKLMRDHKVLALTMKTPEFKSIFSVPVPPMPPMPAAPVAVPAAPAVPAVPAVPAAPAPAAVPAPPPPPPPPPHRASLPL
ncbi:PDZ domain-containing protein [Dokdonella fugitiva]|jgi:S1-C subfamily serine protease|uniref:PDZ domain-containing protein n=1 Tax=Dokdonella fugitiva TaxID=328517 RepID=A0A4R2HZG7_9GAMM|nr:PDZ domain-containing protein [Dokdonella fugitiva]TCO36837.1 PDZ domain-containing protein [Dokdonella fugitiva]